MTNCLDIAKMFSTKQDAAGEDRMKNSYQISIDLSKRDERANDEKVIDYSDDVVVRKLRRMLP